MMKAIVAIAFLFAVASAQQFCVQLTQDDTTCDGSRAGWPVNVCSSTDSPVLSSATCDSAFVGVTAWMNTCPLKNVDNSSFCEGNGYSFAYVNSTFCNAYWVPCNTSDDCNVPVAPAAPAAPVAFVPFCYDCCLFCFDDAACTAKIEDTASFQLYTNSTTCTPCLVTPPVADTPVAEPVTATPQTPTAEVPSAEQPTAPTGSQPTTTTRPISRPAASGAASVAASVTLIVAAALLA